MNMVHLRGIPPLFTNTFLLITDKNNGVLIDPGTTPWKLRRALRKHNVNLTHVLLTHGHWDHKLGLNSIIKRYNPKVMMSEIDAGRYEVDADGYFTDFGSFEIDNLTFKTLFTPGHTEGSVVIQCEDKLFAGDTLFADDIGRTDLADGSMESMRESLKKIVDNIDENVTVYPGHAEFTTLKKEKAQNPYLRF